ncbi:50S ribosomal protein L7/L12 [Mycoplasmoides gallisepticum]|uniref:Large ribosomal subunit protein bL12 n=1 Tax=Mycoplasmoides gallisepticum WI01_2001.043-13-2P TaxID=1159201 RepID=J3T907_MYCGL|nr:50S ribosomal protein L7/L12 [Mycoplasmoides gallisepticum]AFP75782.1 50S ribosomal protein L7/L12 [Mycoplasmoides gallisepticum VA94_7994-1-7P]AFP76549.1 50S ribosomal protein L7/L12 [Mycoplasmoides gallisepticum NC95_13295-2-2P]AFP77303.1 50S ribosomal protein L7/L12 [Mycoplasmoides gallisepticum NC96_1596-4-2P]AFP78074.1 50S ribosomal protein L7/L12 [Mycoplasmoides gallisepticum NY01_2001.047-5-1P]AFP78834.1 50S ribosomal protein L7/L12 [Mycoplasmoides gallisepticum WI01_2001.043-13-2P]
MAKLTKEQFIESLKEMTIVEINDVIKAIEEAFGVSAAAPVAAAAAPAAAAPTEATVVLVSAGDKKVEVIKLVREVTGLGLMDAKKAVDTPPATIKENMNIEEANALKAKFEAVGAKVDLK